ncbi:O-antigen ligase family protein [Sphingobium sp.]|uniref:O-antigen ligase family protein n=1 Tax=Sphingobium sp. TaxID=1912891 RepID=UPI003BB653BC
MQAALAALLILTMLGPFMTFASTQTTGEGSPVRQVAYILVFGLLIFGTRPFDHPRRLLVIPMTMLLALGWCWLSIGWAIDPGIAVRRLILTSVIIWSLFIAIDQLGYERPVKLLRNLLIAILVANFITVFLFPDFGVHPMDEIGDKRLIGDWRGVLMHKNVAGAVCAITIITFLFDADRYPKLLRGAVIAASLLFLILTQSKTSLGLLGFCIAVGFLFERYNAKYRLFVISALCMVGIAGMLLLNLYRNPLAMQFSDPDAFTGRAFIWESLLTFAADHPLLGAGFGSFWNIGPASPIFKYGNGWVQLVTTGHNGFLDLLATIGLPGLVLAMVAAFIAPVARLLTRTSINPARGALVLAIMLFCFGHNFTESSLLDRDSIVEVALIFAIALIRPLSSTRGSRMSKIWGDQTGSRSA